ncbi:3'-5' ssDNA/RNA exonuclease TatD [uncultured Cedecea sp.]|uniref:3'-5' ssDNA/RNA exonuclease TatD n=1 Tax=uncultured Cedecea sp. TaxID=988762 RepID=UPI002603B0DF|nr:3'-5' ssDNA/RNA exonuclease TatD [uncultured Cedecea sp.]
MFDIGINLTHSQFEKDSSQVIARAQQAGVNGMILTGTSLQDSAQALALAQQHSNCWSTAGIHPHEASSWNESTAEAIRNMANAPQVVAVGECGLDFNRNFSTPAEQEHAFTEQLALATDLMMPVFLHCRDAHDRFLALLDPWLEWLPGVVVHCFTGTESELHDYLRRGLLIGITGWVCDERRGLELREMLPQIPAQQLLLETDAPFLLPRDLDPKPASHRNEPCYLPHIVNKVAQWRGEDPAWLGQVTEENARRLFRLGF